MAFWVRQVRQYFNPRSREGSDQRIKFLAVYSMISIHAPVKGATGLANFAGQLKEFQSTLP